jgi:hypothetical protein
VEVFEHCLVGNDGNAKDDWTDKRPVALVDAIEAPLCGSAVILRRRIEQ